MLIDAKEGVSEQDSKIAGYIHDQGKAVIIVVNKWDIVEKDEKTIDKYKADIKNELSFMDYAPMVFISAKTGQRVNKVMELINHVSNQHSMRISTGMLNDIISEAVLTNQPAISGGRRLKIYYATQVSVKPPTFALFVNEPSIMHFSYKRYLENQIRKAFSFEGTPIRFLLRQRE
jgi:GTP-binding protein